MHLWVNNSLLVLLVLTASGAILMRDLIGAVLILACYSFVLALIWAALGAADVAFTECVVGAGLSTVFFLLTLFATSPVVARQPRPRYPWLAVAGLVALGGLLVLGARDLPRIGDPLSPPNVHVSPAYLQRSLDETRTPSVITSVIMDYRGFDTLIETTVIFTAGIAGLLLLRRDHGPSA